MDSYIAPIDPNDPIEKLVCESIRIGEIANDMRYKGIGPVSKIESLEAESERLWNEAKRLGKAGVSELNYQALANAFLKECIEDYEDILSGGLENNKKNRELIEDILEHQMFVKIDMMEMLRRIERIYKNEFLPYVKLHREDIIKEWKFFDKKHIKVTDRSAQAHHHCPLCGGVLKPVYYNKLYKIGCTGCKLSCP